MKKKIIVIIVLLSTALLPAQVFGPRHLITEDAGSGNRKLGDLDGDGDLDLMSINSSRLGWQENLDGQGNFGPLIEIAPGMGQSLVQELVDLDEDNKLDILISYFDNDFIAWFRNLGGGNFAPMQTLASGLSSASGVVSGDIDRDGDLDIVLGVTNGVGFYWIEHLDGNGTFGPLIPINTTLSQARMQRLGDIDGDGDLDILTNSVGGTILSWFENTNGNGDFSVQHVIANSGFYENTIVLKDLDGDDDMDIFSITVERAFWRENTNGQGNFVEAQNVYNDAGGLVAAVEDFNNDEKIDVAFSTDLGLAYSLNNGSDFDPPMFIEPLAGFNIDGLTDAGDIDGDGDIDLTTGARDLGASGTVINTYWLENTTILGTSSFTIEGLQLTPNPVGDILRIQSQEPLQQATFYDVLGQSLMTVHKDFEAIPVSNLPTGLYFVEVRTTRGAAIKQVVKE